MEALFKRLGANKIGMQYKILVVEDDKDLQEGLRTILLENNYTVESVSEGSKALRKVEESLPDLVVLDLGLPDISGETICTRLKKNFPELPVIILTARDTTEDIVHGLNIGADDYIPKPFKEEELVARIKARLRKGRDSLKLRVGNLELDSQKIQVKRGGKEVKLTQKEFLLLEYLMRNKGRILSREMILDRVWSYSPEVESRVVDVYIGYLRKKIDRPFEKKLLHSTRGFGYMIKP